VTSDQSRRRSHSLHGSLYLSISVASWTAVLLPPTAHISPDGVRAIPHKKEFTCGLGRKTELH
jgi:hypothetical protein